MSAHHGDPLYLRNAKIVRAQTRAVHTRGEAVPCIGCGREIAPGHPFDVGHIVDAALGGTHDLDNLGPQHRGENRRSGGRLGARITNTRTRAQRGLPTWL